MSMTSDEAVSHIKAMIESLECGIKAIESNKEWEGIIPSVQPKMGRWIPVTERLPEEGEIVLVTECNALGDNVRLSRWQGEAYGFTIGLVKAWMPLPDPWKGDKDG